MVGNCFAAGLHKPLVLSALFSLSEKAPCEVTQASLELCGKPEPWITPAPCSQVAGATGLHLQASALFQVSKFVVPDSFVFGHKL